MEFTNNMVSIAAVPQIEQVEYKPLEREYLRVKRISFFITFFLLGVALAAAIFILHLYQSWWFITIGSSLYVLLALLVWIAQTLDFSFSGYALREKDVLYRSGWFIQKTRIVPLSRIQHVSVQSGPIERSFKLASVSMFTAGSGQADFTIRGIRDTTANQLKDWLTELMKEENDTK